MASPSMLNVRNSLANVGMVLFDLNFPKIKTLCDTLKSSGSSLLSKMLTFSQTTTVTKAEVESIKTKLCQAFKSLIKVQLRNDILN